MFVGKEGLLRARCRSWPFLFSVLRTASSLTHHCGKCRASCSHENRLASRELRTKFFILSIFCDASVGNLFLALLGVMQPEQLIFQLGLDIILGSRQFLFTQSKPFE